MMFSAVIVGGERQLSLAAASLPPVAHVGKLLAEDAQSHGQRLKAPETGSYRLATSISDANSPPTSNHTDRNIDGLRSQPGAMSCRRI